MSFDKEAGKWIKRQFLAGISYVKFEFEEYKPMRLVEI
jgi:hypothetical protein